MSKNNSLKIPLQFWFNRDIQLEMSITEIKKFDWFVCACSEDKIHTILENKEQELKRDDLSDGLKDLLRLVHDTYLDNIIECGSEGLKLIEYCIDFLLLRNEHQDDLRFASISQFICGFLEIDYDSGYPYLLMNLLDSGGYKFMTHGSGIRCGWLTSLKDTIFDHHEISNLHRQKIMEWIEKK